MTALPNYVPEIRRALNDPKALCEALGLIGGPRTFERQAGGGVIVRCPWHEENTPSCSVRVAKDGTIAVKCFGCDRGSDALGLVAAARGLSMRGPGFRDVLVEAARLAGLWQTVAALEGGEPLPPPALPAPRAEQAPEATRGYPEDAERVWGILERITDVGICAEYLTGRGINPELVEANDLARAIPDAGPLPAWARYRGASWRETGHRIIVPMWDSAGVLQSVRAWRVTESDGPKRLPPGGHRASGLVLADSVAQAWLAGQLEPKVVVIAEGEPDGLVNMCLNCDAQTAVISVISGSWGPDFAARVPIGAKVIIRTHLDDAGNRYATEIESSLRRRTPAIYRRREAA